MSWITTPFVTFTLLAAVAARDARAGPADDYWPMWRGPRASGVSPTGRPPLHWSETQNIRWKVAVPGAGTSSPIVWGDRIFFLTAIETDREGAPEPPTGSGAAASCRQSSSATRAT